MCGEAAKSLAEAERRPLGHEFLMRSEEARIGTSVGVLDGGRRPGKGRVGTIERTYGHPDQLAMDVLFEDGSVELYWCHELRITERQPLL